MRTKLVAGNWKMNTTVEEGLKLASEVNDLVKSKGAADVQVVVAPPFVHLSGVAGVVDNDRVKVSAQNCATEEKGAFTGEVSAAMVASTGAAYTIIGHSERRTYYKEDDAVLLKKVNQALAHKLKPIFCLGEVLEEREAGKQNEVVASQLENAVFQLSAEDFRQVVIAYEPVWAIGTGKTASPGQAQEMHAFIRKQVASKFGAQAAENLVILYGGSMKPANANDLLKQPDVDGGLIGGASLKPADFLEIINAYE